MASWLDYKSDGTNLDLTSLGELHVCQCGSDMFKAIVSFENNVISTYITEGECLFCGSRVTLPTECESINE